MAKLHWTRRVRSIVSSVADITGDWFFFNYVRGLEDGALTGDQDTWEYIVMGICVVSSLIGFLNVMTHLCGCQLCGGRSIICGLAPTKVTHLIETVMEDIPQVAVSALIVRELRDRPLSAQSVFNLTTSGINFFLDALDIFEPIIDLVEDEVQKQKNADDDEEYYGHGSSAQTY